MIKKIKMFFVNAWKTFKEVQRQNYLSGVLENTIKSVDELRKEADEKLKRAEVIYTTVRSFASENGEKLFWPWVRAVLVSDEYKYLIFFLRENTIRELVQTSDVNMIHEINGRLKMLQILDTFLAQGLTQYDADQKNKV
jgi:hypothetical protein